MTNIQVATYAPAIRAASADSIRGRRREEKIWASRSTPLPFESICPPRPAHRAFVPPLFRTLRSPISVIGNRGNSPSEEIDRILMSGAPSANPAVDPSTLHLAQQEFLLKQQALQAELLRQQDEHNKDAARLNQRYLDARAEVEAARQQAQSREAALQQEVNRVQAEMLNAATILDQRAQAQQQSFNAANASPPLTHDVQWNALFASLHQQTALMQQQTTAVVQLCATVAKGIPAPQAQPSAFQAVRPDVPHHQKPPFPISLNKFDGSTSVETFLDDITLVFDTHGLVDDVEQFRWLLLNVSSQIRAQLTVHMGNESSFIKAKTFLLERYRPKGTQYDLRYRAYNLRVSGNDIDSYCAAFTDIRSRMDHPSEDELLFLFLQGLPSFAATEIFREDAKILEDAITVVTNLYRAKFHRFSSDNRPDPMDVNPSQIRFQGNSRGRRGRGRGRGFSNRGRGGYRDSRADSQRSSSPHHGRNSSPSRNFSNTNRQPPGSRTNSPSHRSPSRGSEPSADQKCFRCHQPGHFAVNCRVPSPAKDGSRQRTPSPRSKGPSNRANH